MYWKCAKRNLGRNAKRSVITGVGIALGLGLCMATLGIMDGLSHNLITGTTDSQVGHIQLHHPDYLKERRLRQTLLEQQRLTEKLLSVEGVQAVSPRLLGWGYLSAGDKSFGVQLQGFDPVVESQVTTLANQLEDGEMIQQPTPWKQGGVLTEADRQLDRQLTEAAIDNALDNLEADVGLAVNSELLNQTETLVDLIAPTSDQPPAVVLGYKLAKNLNVNIGDSLTLLYENALGAQSSVIVRLQGTSKFGVDLIDRTRVILHLQDLQRLLLMENQVHEVAIRLNEPKLADDMLVQLKRVIGQDTLLEQQNVSIQTWSQLRPDILALILSNQALMGSLAFIIFLIAGVGVMNTMLVSVTERKHEFGLMKAIGFSPTQITTLVMLETSVLTLLGALAGILIGLLLTAYLYFFGIDISQFGEFSMSGVGMSQKLTAQLTLVSLLTPLVVITLISMLAALYPAIQAARISPIMGMRSQ